jgi:predicted CXXCH cytochrome family protein
MGAAVADHQGIVCVVCHDPHGSSHAGQLRFPIDTADEETNLCMQCHNRRGNPAPGSDGTMRGPHAPEGPLLLGEAGWFPPGFNPTGKPVRGSHGGAGNARYCASCHVATFTVTDANGGFVANATGHLFQAIPCLDEAGYPTVGECDDVDQRDFRGCAISGCHTDVEGARNAYLTAENRIERLNEELGELLVAAGFDPGAETINVAGTGVTAGAGGWFNYKLADLPGSATHNPFLMEQLLVETIRLVRQTYGLSSPTGVSLELQLD